MQYAKQALALSQKLNFKNEEGTADYNCAVALAGISYVGPQGNFGDAIKYYNEAVKIFKKNGNQSALANCYAKIGTAYYSFKQDAGEDIKNTLTALKIYEAIGNKPDIANCLQSLGVIHFEIGNDSAAIKYASATLRMLQ